MSIIEKDKSINESHRSYIIQREGKGGNENTGERSKEIYQFLGTSTILREDDLKCHPVQIETS